MEEKRRKVINKNSKIAWQQQLVNIASDVREKERLEKLKKEKSEKGIDRDSHNRKYIATRIRTYITEGMHPKEAVKRVIEEEKEIVEQFDYLTKNGLDIRKIFANWAQNPHYNYVEKPFEVEDDGR